MSETDLSNTQICVPISNNKQILKDKIIKYVSAIIDTNLRESETTILKYVDVLLTELINT